MNRNLALLDALAAHLAGRPDAVALLGLGSVGQDTDRLDEHSDADFFGLHRDLRGERLSAARLIQTHAVDHVLALAEESAAVRPDPFDPARRAEQAHPDVPLAAMVGGYAANRESAAALRALLAG